MSVMQANLTALEPQLIVAASKVEETMKIVLAESAEAAEVEKVTINFIYS